MCLSILSWNLLKQLSKTSGRHCTCIANHSNQANQSIALQQLNKLDQATIYQHQSQSMGQYKMKNDNHLEYAESNSSKMTEIAIYDAHIQQKENCWNTRTAQRWLSEEVYEKQKTAKK